MSLERVTISGTLFELGVQCQTVLHFINPDGAQTPQQIAGEIQTNYIATMRLFQAAVFRYDYITVRRLGAGGPTPYNHTIAPPIVGVSGANIQHPCVNWIIQLHSQTIGKHGRGRIYLPGVQTSYITRTRPSTSGLTQWNTSKPNLMRYVAGGAALINLVINPKGNTSALNTVQVDDFILRPICGIQRRRNELVGI